MALDRALVAPIDPWPLALSGRWWALMASYSWPLHPDMRLSQNGRRQLVPLAEKSLVAQAVKEWSDLLVMSRVARVLDFPVVLTWTCIFADYRKAYDATNLAGAFKPAEDALRHNGLMPDDNPKFVRRVSYESIVDPHRAPMTILVIERAEG